MTQRIIKIKDGRLVRILNDIVITQECEIKHLSRYNPPESVSEFIISKYAKLNNCSKCDGFEYEKGCYRE